MISFFVPGLARPQGSKRHVGRGIMVESSKQLKPWRMLVAHEAGIAMKGQALFLKPILLELQFRFQRPKAHYSAAGTLKPKVPYYPTGRNLGDADKLARAVCDALTGIVFGDDAQVARLRVDKLYSIGGEQAGVSVEARELMF